MGRPIKLETIMEGVLAALISLLNETGIPYHCKIAIQDQSGFSQDQIQDALLIGIDRGFIGEVDSGKYIPLLSIRGEAVPIPSPKERQRILEKIDAAAEIISTEERLQLIESQNRKLVSAFKELKKDIQDAVRSLHDDISGWRPVVERLKEIIQ